MSGNVRMTYATASVLYALSEGHAYGFDIAEVTGLRRGTVYPILRRLEDARMVDGHWEDTTTPHLEGRPARRYYRLTESGRALARAGATAFPAVALALSRPR